MGVVGVDEQLAFAQIDIVFDALFARADKDRFGSGIGGRDQADFARLVVARGDDQPFLIGRERRADAEAFVILVVEFDVR